jgi:ATP-grasp domain
MPEQTPTHTARPGAAAAAERPRILLTATLRWPIAARLAMAFAELGCRVDVLCPRGHPVTHVRAASRLHRHDVLRPLRALRAALLAAKPDLVIPCDDEAAVLLQQLHARCDEAEPDDRALSALIRRSLGSPAACLLATSRGSLLALAAELGIRVPHTSPVATPQALDDWLARRPLPAVIKIDGSWGGRGVAITHSHDEAQGAFARLSARPTLRNALVRALLDRDLAPLRSALRHDAPPVTLQDHVSGHPANRAVACWHGEVLAGTSVLALRTQQATGPATVVRVIDNAEMEEAVRRLVRRLGLSGLWGVDFVIEAATGAAYLIEVNPRATPITHLALGPGHDLPAALLAALGGPNGHAPREPIGRDVIALFPGEWQRDAASEHLHRAHHDIPWAEPALVRDGLLRPWAERGWMARSWARLRDWPWRAAPGRPCASEQTSTDGSHYNSLSPHAHKGMK